MYNHKQDNFNLGGQGMVVKTVTLVLGFFFLRTVVVNADVYRVYLYYDYGKLVFDRNYDKKVEISRGIQIGDNYPMGDFKAEIADSRGNVLHIATFNPRPRLYWDNDNPEGGCGSKLLDQGQSSLLLPYFQTAIELKIYDPKNVLVLEYDISYLDSLAGVSPSPASNVQVPPVTTQDTLMPLWLFWVVAPLVLAVIAFSIWWRKHRSESIG